MTNIERLKKIIDERMKDNETNIIAVHVIRSYCATRLDCDKFGNIKTCTYGGVTRTLCSSAAIKNGQMEYIKKLYKELYTDAYKHLVCLFGNKSVESSVSIAYAFGTTEESFEFGISSPLLLEEYSIDIDQMIENEMRYNGIETREGAREIARLIIGIYMETIYWSHPTDSQKDNLSTPEPTFMYVTFSKGMTSYGDIFETPAKNLTDAINTFADEIRENYEGVGKDKKMLFLSPLYFDRKEEFGLTDDNVNVTYKEKDIIDFVKDNIQ